MNDSKRNEILRITLTVTICMLAGKLMGLHSPVYLALYPVIVMTKGKDYSLKGLVKMFVPVLCAASLALVVCEVFSNHPFIIWAISLLFFDYMRKKANTPPKLGAMLMPTFNWILVVIFSMHTDASMPTRIHEIFISMAITIIVAKTIVSLFPIVSSGKPPVFELNEVTYQHRFVSTALIGSGVGFLMIVDLISATFCLVPVIAAASQFTREKFLATVKLRFITQVGGCALAAIFTIVLVEHQSVIGFYGFALAMVIYVIAKAMVNEVGIKRDIHGDALLATMLPIQLYITSVNDGLERTFLRGWELTVTLFILFALYQLTERVQRK